MRHWGILCAALAVASIPACAQQVEGRFERTLNVSGAVDLDVVTDSGGIVVKQGQAASVQVRATLKSQRNISRADAERRIRALEADPPVQQSGNVVRIGHVRDKDLLRGISMRLEILTPAETKLRARADSGGITVAGIGGPLDCQTDSGGIEASDIGSDVHATADSGGIRIANVRGKVVARADSGGIQAMSIGGAVDVSTDSGGVKISQSSPGPIRVRADSGGADVKLAPGSGYDVTAVSGSGRISVPEMTVRGSFSRGRAEGKVRGGGPLVDVQVDSGHVTIE